MSGWTIQSCCSGGAHHDMPVLRLRDVPRMHLAP
jgi:hypothetical protein